jgi:hypothetical protein
MVRGFVGALLLLPGCVIENNFLPPHWTDLFYQAPDDQVDILFVVDDSGSMTEEQQALSRGFGTFLAELEASETAYRIALVSTSQDSADLGRTAFIGDPPVLNPLTDTISLFQERVLIGVAGSDHEKGLQAAADALEANPEFLRTGANLVVLFVTDEEDCSDDGRLDGHPAIDCYNERQELTPVPDLVERITRTKREGEKVRLGGILGPLDGSCADAYAGARYIRAIGQLGGPLARICDADWTPTLRQLGAVATGMMDRFVLSYPADPDTLQVFVDDFEVAMDPENGWTYDPVTRTLAFHGDAVPERNAEIRVEFEVASGG